MNGEDLYEDYHVIMTTVIIFTLSDQRKEEGNYQEPKTDKIKIIEISQM